MRVIKSPNLATSQIQYPIVRGWKLKSLFFKIIEQKQNAFNLWKLAMHPNSCPTTVQVIHEEGGAKLKCNTVCKSHIILTLGLTSISVNLETHKHCSKCVYVYSICSKAMWPQHSIIPVSGSAEWTQLLVMCRNVEGGGAFKLTTTTIHAGFVSSLLEAENWKWNRGNSTILSGGV